jgi:hypothetical protein
MSAARDSRGVEAALDWAEIAAMLGDYGEAITWLDYVELQEGALNTELAARRRHWTALQERATDT